MQFLLAGFTHDAGRRVFEFEGIADDRTRTNFFVAADLALSRTYGIRVQELPLLCLRLLKHHDFVERERALTYTEEDMRLHVAVCAAERSAAQKHRAPRRASTTAATNGIAADTGGLPTLNHGAFSGSEFAPVIHQQTVSDARVDTH